MIKASSLLSHAIKPNVLYNLLQLADLFSPVPSLISIPVITPALLTAQMAGIASATLLRSSIGNTSM